MIIKVCRALLGDGMSLPSGLNLISAQGSAPDYLHQDSLQVILDNDCEDVDNRIGADESTTYKRRQRCGNQRIPNSPSPDLGELGDGPPSLAFPTEERVRWKEQQKIRKAAGIEVKKKHKYVEAHFDDCGTDISGMGPDDVNDYITAEVIGDLEPHEPNSDDEWTQGLTQWWLLGSDLSDNLGPQGQRLMFMR